MSRDDSRGVMDDRDTIVDYDTIYDIVQLRYDDYSGTDKYGEQ